jgi:tetratricopeptide (TPR) repeat protein
MARARRRTAADAPPAAPAGPGWLAGWRPLALIAVAGVLAFATSLGTPFFLDDTEAIERNPYITALLPIGRVLTAPPQSAVSGRPLVSVSLAVNYALGGLQPAGYHAWNLAVHIVAGWLVWAVARRTLRSPRLPAAVADSADGLAVATALLWLVHPLHTEVIAYVITRTESMMAVAWLVTLYATIRAIAAPGRRLWPLLAVTAGLAGATIKESIVTAPLMALLYDVVFGAGSLREAWRQRRGLYTGLLFSWGVLAALHWDTPRSSSAGFSAGMSSWDYLLTQAPMILGYLRLAVWPWPLVADYGVTEPATLAAVWPSLAVVTSLAVGTVWLWRWHRPLAFLATWFFVTLAPASSVVPIATEVGAERRMYLPLVALVALAVLGLRLVIRRWLPPARHGIAAAAATGAVAAALAATSAARGLDYRDPLHLWQDVIAARPHGRAYHNLGIVLEARGQSAEALAAYRTAAATLPEARYSLGYALATAGDERAALVELREFLARRPQDANAPLATNLVGMLLTRQGDVAGAITFFERTLAMRPQDADARRGLAAAYTALGAERSAAGRFAEASDAFARSAAAAPDAPGTHLNLGISLMQQGRAADAEQAFRRGLAVAPSHVGLHNALGAALATRGDLAAAAAEFNAVLALEPGNVEALAGLDVLARRARAR